MIKDIVVNLGLGDNDPAGQFAVSLAERLEAHVLGVAFAYEPIIPGTVMGGIPPEIIESQRTESNERARNAAARFEALAKRSSLSAETRLPSVSVSRAAEQLSQLARRFDLTIVGQPDRDKGVPEEIVDENVLFDGGRPVIFVPYIFKGAAKFDRVMVCWDGSRAAARAVADSLPLLKLAKQVEVVIVATGRPKSDEIPGADLGQHLARHGLKVEVKRIAASDIDVPSTLLSYAADSGTDFIVMGGYGHSRLREFVLGGATRGILQSMTVPVLMSH